VGPVSDRKIFTASGGTASERQSETNGIRAEKDHQYLFSLGLDGGQMKTIGLPPTDLARNP
jgi:hypothetical protein